MLYGIVGGYLLYLAYELAQNMINDVATTMPRWVGILAVIAFAGIGVTLLVYAWKIWKQGREDQDQNPVDLTEAEAEEKGAPEAGADAAAGDGNVQNPKEPEA